MESEEIMGICKFIMIIIAGVSIGGLLLWKVL